MTKIEWTDETWNPVTGCDKVSQGCKNCYAEVMHKRLMGMFPDKYSKPFLGNIELHEDELERPLKWKKSCMVFVNSMSDLFHDNVHFKFIFRVFLIMERCPNHTFQILTKRSNNMFAFITYWKGMNKAPLMNVILGFSAEDQTTFDSRSHYIRLIKIAGWRTMVSAEPLLGPIDMHLMDEPHHKNLGAKLDWVIVGGESGRNARPMHPDWVCSLRDQCKSAGVAFFFKQWGTWEPDSHVSFNGPFCLRSPKHFIIDIDGRGYLYRDMFDWDEEAQKREDEMNITKKNNAWWMANTGKSKSGNIFIDGNQYLEFPTLNK